jgi:hypothetical protein
MLGISSLPLYAHAKWSAPPLTQDTGSSSVAQNLKQGKNISEQTMVSIAPPASAASDQGSPLPIEPSAAGKAYQLVMGQYLLEPPHKRFLENELKEASKYTLSDEYVHLVPQSGDLEWEHFKDKRQQLLADAIEYLANVELPARVSLPALASEASHAQIIDEVYRDSTGLVIGEAYASLASKRFLIDNFATLKAQGVKTLYFEHLLVDFSADDLKVFNNEEKLLPHLATRLHELDTKHHVEPGPYTFQNVVVEARRHGLEVVSLDCAAAWYAKGVSSGGTDARLRMFSYLASHTIQAHQAASGEHKWVALVGNSHSNQIGSVPGLAELNKAIGIRVAEPGEMDKPGVLVDPGLETSFNKGVVKADYLLKVEVPAPVIVANSRLPAL